MTKHVSKIVLTIGCMAIAISLLAQSQKKEAAADKDKAKAKPKVKPIPVFLGNSDVSSGPITKHDFDSLLQQGLTAKDSAGRSFKVTGFAFTYAERNLYEDSVGNPMLLTDYLSEYSESNNVSDFLKKNIPERSKAGDTVIFDQISVLSPEGKGAPGKYMKFVLKK